MRNPLSISGFRHRVNQANSLLLDLVAINHIVNSVRAVRAVYIVPGRGYSSVYEGFTPICPGWPGETPYSVATRQINFRYL